MDNRNVNLVAIADINKVHHNVAKSAKLPFETTVSANLHAMAVFGKPVIKYEVLLNACYEKRVSQRCKDANIFAAY